MRSGTNFNIFKFNIQTNKEIMGNMELILIFLIFFLDTGMWNQIAIDAVLVDEAEEVLAVVEQV